ncbi:MAG TPA: RNA 2',3'-cyclic phosphodiesterase [Candidatus Paceibacterota bacterium]|nr:RNA 2',3'-cyclic phosphodiesterase [Candidatus Paceibacterota bacterium]
MKKRIFAAIAISDSLQEEILRYEEKWNRLPVRWLQGKNLHLTLVPPWYGEVGETVASFANTAGSGVSAELTFQKVQYGPDEHRPRLVWAKGKAAKSIHDLKCRLEHLLEVKSEYRPWLPHLTIARFKPEDFSRFPVKKIDDAVSWSENVQSFVLMESSLSRSGAEYKILEEFKL